MSALLAAAVERAVGRALNEANGQVEALISAELDRQLAAIAQTVIAERLGESDSLIRVHESDSASKTCRACGQSKAISEFERGRGTCRECRRLQARTRAERADAGERPRSPQHE